MKISKLSGVASEEGELLTALRRLGHVLMRHNLGTLRSIGVSDAALQTLASQASPPLKGRVDSIVIALDHGPCAIERRAEPEWEL